MKQIVFCFLIIIYLLKTIYKKCLSLASESISLICIALYGSLGQIVFRIKRTFPRKFTRDTRIEIRARDGIDTFRILNIIFDCLTLGRGDLYISC